MFTWLRLSGNKLLDWQRCFSYQPRDITWAQQQVRGSSCLGDDRDCFCLTGDCFYCEMRIVASATSPVTSHGHSSR